MNYWTMGRQLDQQMFEFRNKGMNGTPVQREEFLKQVFHAARGNAGILMVAAPFLGKSKEEILEVLMTKVMEEIAEQAKETGFDAKQTEMYLEAHRKAYESLAEMHGINVTGSADPPVLCSAACGGSNCTGQCSRPFGHSTDHFCNVCHRSW